MKTIRKSHHFYLIPDDDYVAVDDARFSYMLLKDADNNIVDRFDYYQIGQRVRIDHENGVFRIYPLIGADSVYYDADFHTIYGEGGILNDQDL